MTVHKVNNLFSNEDIKYFNDVINQIEMIDDSHLGRVKCSIFDIPNEIVYKMHKIVNDLSDKELSMISASFVEYSAKYGQPNLPPHFDADTTDLIIDFQLSSNICWELGVNKELYPLADNSAIIFNPNTEIHWRPHRRFEDGEYVKMLFIRFANASNLPNNSDINYSQDHEIFKEVRDYRDSLNAGQTR